MLFFWDKTKLEFFWSKLYKFNSFLKFSEPIPSIELSYNKLENLNGFYKVIYSKGPAARAYKYVAILGVCLKTAILWFLSNDFVCLLLILNNFPICLI